MKSPTGRRPGRWTMAYASGPTKIGLADPEVQIAAIDYSALERRILAWLDGETMDNFWKGLTDMRKSEQPEPKFKAGDVVHLVSGSPNMTVVKVKWTEADDYGIDDACYMVSLVFFTYAPNQSNYIEIPEAALQLALLRPFQPSGGAPA